MSFPPPTPVPPFGSSSKFGNYQVISTAGPAPGVPVVQQMADLTYRVFPLTYFGATGDDAFWINLALNAPNPNSYYTDPANKVQLINSQYFPRSTIVVPSKAILQGVGPGSVIMCPAFSGGLMLSPQGNRPIIYFHDQHGGDGSDPINNRMGGLRDFAIDCTNNPPFITAIDAGDGWGGKIRRIYLDSDDSQSSTIGLRFGNDFYFTEKWHVKELTIRGFGTQLYGDTTVVQNQSHGYNEVEITVAVRSFNLPSENLMTLDKSVNWYANKLTVKGNHYATSSPTPVTGWALGLLNGSTISENEIYFRVEGDTNHGNFDSLYKFFVDSTTGGAAIINSYGVYDVTGPTTGTGKPTNAVSGQFQFAGISPNGAINAIRTTPPWLT